MDWIITKFQPATVSYSERESKAKFDLRTTFLQISQTNRLSPWLSQTRISNGRDHLQIVSAEANTLNKQSIAADRQVCCEERLLLERNRTWMHSFQRVQHPTEGLEFSVTPLVWGVDTTHTPRTRVPRTTDILHPYKNKCNKIFRDVTRKYIREYRFNKSTTVNPRSSQRTFRVRQRNIRILIESALDKPTMEEGLTIF